MFFLFLFLLFLTKTCTKLKNNEYVANRYAMNMCVCPCFFKGNHIRDARVFLVRCAVEKSMIVCALLSFWITESCVVSCCALLFRFQRSPMSSSATGPLVRPLHCLSLPVLNRADFGWIDEVRCYA